MAHKSSLPDIVTGQWMSNDVVTRLPHVRRDFDLNRDPYRAKQLRDLEKSEVQRREEQTGRGSSMVRKDQPKAILKPPKEIRSSVDNQRFRSRWLAEQRAAELSQRNQTKPVNQQQPSNLNKYRSPQR